MKKIFILSLLMLTVLSVFGQGYWKKDYRTDDFTNERYVILIHYNNNQIDAIWDKSSEALTIFNECPKAAAFNITWDAYMKNGGIVRSYEANVDINCTGKIYNPTLIVSYPTVDDPSHTFFSMIKFDMTLAEMKANTFVSIRYYDNVWSGLVVKKVSCMGFTNAYNK